MNQGTGKVLFQERQIGGGRLLSNGVEYWEGRRGSTDDDGTRDLLGTSVLVSNVHKYGAVNYITDFVKVI